jgi:hypothetical protein
MQSIQPLLKSVGWKAEIIEDWSQRMQAGKIDMLNRFGMLTFLFRSHLNEGSSLIENTLGLG